MTTSPQFFFYLENHGNPVSCHKCKILISLKQNHKEHLKKLALGIKIFQCDEENGKYTYVSNLGSIYLKLRF